MTLAGVGVASAAVHMHGMPAGPQPVAEVAMEDCAHHAPPKAGGEAMQAVQCALMCHAASPVLAGDVMAVAVPVLAGVEVSRLLQRAWPTRAARVPTPPPNSVG